MSLIFLILYKHIVVILVDANKIYLHPIKYLQFACFNINLNVIHYFMLVLQTKMLGVHFLNTNSAMYGLKIDSICIYFATQNLREFEPCAHSVCIGD